MTTTRQITTIATTSSTTPSKIRSKHDPRDNFLRKCLRPLQLIVPELYYELPTARHNGLVHLRSLCIDNHFIIPHNCSKLTIEERRCKPMSHSFAASMSAARIRCR